MPLFGGATDRLGFLVEDPVLHTSRQPTPLFGGATDRLRFLVEDPVLHISREMVMLWDDQGNPETA